jgi:membrane protein
MRFPTETCQLSIISNWSAILMKVQVIGQMLRATWRAWNEDKVPRMGAALAYYAVFSMSPLFMIVIGIAGLVFGDRAAEGEVVKQIENLVGGPVAEATQEILKTTKHTGRGLVVAIIGGITLLFGASGVLIELQDALNTIWKVKPKTGLGLWEVVRARFVSFLAVLGTGLLVLGSLALSATLATVARVLTATDGPDAAVSWQALESVISLGIISILFAMIYKLLPDTPIRWGDVWFGATITACLFTAGKFLLGLYLGQTGTASAFGAAGSLVVILLWVYYSSQVFLFGAEFTHVHASRRGSAPSGP